MGDTPSTLSSFPESGPQRGRQMMSHLDGIGAILLELCKELAAQGYHEHQVLGPGQESATAARDCTKNPGHTTFIPVDKFTKEHIPDPNYRDDKDVFDYITVMAGLTVRLRVGITSPDRPIGGYYGTNDGGSRTGTGYISYVGRSKTQERSWELEVETAQHVVFDDKESKTTKADLFYDNEESRLAGRMKTMKGTGMVTIRNNTDYCRLVFTTSDADIGTRLEALHKRRVTLRDKLRNRFWVDKSSHMVWVVSHPHGIAKHITFGEFKAEQKLGGDRQQFQYSYTADTCPGSSGAPVWGLGGNSRDTKYSWFSYTPHHVKGGGENGCNIGYDW